MNKILLAFLPLLVAGHSFAQNTFPATGNAGIGTTSANSALQIVRGGTNSSNDYPSLQITTNVSGNIYGPILYLNGSSGNNGKTWGLISSGALDAAGTGAAGNFAIYDTQAGSRLVINSAGNVGIGTTAPSSYFHGGNNRVLEISNPNTTVNSQAQLILSTASVAANTSAGAISWISKGSAGSQGLAYIAGVTKGDVTNNASGEVLFATADNNVPVERMRISSTGNLLIGQVTQTNPGYKLDVAGNVRANQIVVNSTGADFVFDKDYHLSSLSKVEKYITENHHLPEIISAEKMTSDGMDIGELNRKLLQKVEELTLYLISKEKRDDAQQKEIDQLKKRLATFTRRFQN
jgi:hypothetical protein